MALDMSKGTGIYIAKTELRFIGYSTIIENQLAKEAREKKYVDGEIKSTPPIWKPHMSRALTTQIIVPLRKN
ncbi:hypothetical protein BT96DRAFT_1010933 [Gymnopus androsaceus JB14]|uniref:Uncharacterized protein n=1 Tax=Gymnopus androsaceus JB14 TaxID=1447944 RepID=A0A6A4G9Z4_9AGAR|nr:hypothetical protein BT96DRAFT_1010933 [Gymnopus androsaceus JB14]